MQQLDTVDTPKTPEPYPAHLLGKPPLERIAYFAAYTVAHPNLLQANEAPPQTDEM